MTYPLLTRLLEYARETSASDVDLHIILEEIMEHSGEVLSMEHYEELLSDVPAKTPVATMPTTIV